MAGDHSHDYKLVVSKHHRAEKEKPYYGIFYFATDAALYWFACACGTTQKQPLWYAVEQGWVTDEESVKSA